jgi:hypothetical protein
MYIYEYIGILFINESDIGWRPFTESWLQKRDLGGLDPGVYIYIHLYLHVYIYVHTYQYIDIYAYQQI